MRQVPNWKWRRDPRIKLTSKHESVAHRLKKQCYTQNEKEVVDTILDYLRAHFRAKFQRMEMTPQEIIDFYDNIESQYLPEEWEDLNRRRYVYELGGPDKETIKVWNSLMFQLLLYKTHK